MTTESTQHAVNVYLRRFEKALMDANQGAYKAEKLFGPETPRQFATAQEALKYANRTDTIGRVPAADAALLNALAAELDL